MLEISKMIKSLTDTESEIKRIIQAIQVHERGITIGYHVTIKDKDIVEFAISFDESLEEDKFVLGISHLIEETMIYCDSINLNGKIYKSYYKYLY